jgi:membrane-associated phospholipid phosphatase
MFIDVIDESASVQESANVERSEQAFELRVERARVQRHEPLPEHPTNGDEDRYPEKFANYTKGLPHDQRGEVVMSAYQRLITAVESGRTTDFDNIPLGAPDPTKQRKLVNPQSGHAFDLAGADSHHLEIPPAPAFASAEQAGEIVENYWMALLRDVAFTDYDTDPMAAAAAADLSQLSDFPGPKVNGQVTPVTLFRGFTAGDRRGPYLSQFLLKAALFGSKIVEQRILTTPPGSDFMTTFADWLDVQRGTKRDGSAFDPTRRYIRNGRDASQYVHIDVPFQAYFDACLILTKSKDQFGTAPLNPGCPYRNSRTQEGFGTFGEPHIRGLLAEVAVRALKAVWYQKWLVHRRLRPEVYAARVDSNQNDTKTYPLHADVLNSAVLPEIFAHNATKNGDTGSYLLPMAFPEGSPLHPSYGSGHATVGGACVTVLKWFFDESTPVEDPQVPNGAGIGLVPYTGSDADTLTVGGELDKLASNIGIGGNISGVHWRSDYVESLRLGEKVAIATLLDFKPTLAEDFNGATFTTFDGQTITV